MEIYCGEPAGPILAGALTGAALRTGTFDDAGTFVAARALVSGPRAASVVIALSGFRRCP